jgi:hypothetical protein
VFPNFLARALSRKNQLKTLVLLSYVGLRGSEKKSREDLTNTEEQEERSSLDEMEMFLLNAR